MQTQQRDGLLGLGMAILFGLVLTVVIPRAIPVPSSIEIASTRPDFWPRILCGILMALSLGLAAKSFLGARLPDSPQPRRAVLSPRHLGIVLLLFAYYLAMEPLGIILSSMLAFIALARIYDRKTSLTVAVTAVALPCVLYFFFSRVMGIPLPTGTLFY